MSTMDEVSELNQVNGNIGVSEIRKVGIIDETNRVEEIG